MKLLTKKQFIILFCILIALSAIIMLFLELDLFSKYYTYIYKRDNELFEIVIPKALINNSLFQKRKFTNDDEIIICADSNYYAKVVIVKNENVHINNPFINSMYFNYLNYNNDYWGAIGIVKMYYHYFSAYSEYFTSGVVYEFDNKIITRLGNVDFSYKFSALKVLRYNEIEFRLQYIKNENLIEFCDLYKILKMVDSIKIMRVN